MEKALLCVSVGTTAQATDGITAVETALRQAAPDCLFARAYTNGGIRRVLAARGQPVDSLPEALAHLKQQGVRQVLVQPTHFLYGTEYETLRTQVQAAVPEFEVLRLGRPLLAGTEDVQALAKVIMRTYPPQSGEALVLVGHGTDQFAGVVYPALQTAFWLAGRQDVLVGTVEGWPAKPEVLAQLQKSGVQAVRLVPLMLAAGRHACRDIAGDVPASWQSVLQAAGYSVRVTLHGLGELPAVQEMYRQRLREMEQGKEYKD